MSALLILVIIVSAGVILGVAASAAGFFVGRHRTEQRLLRAEVLRSDRELHAVTLAAIDQMLAEARSADWQDPAGDGSLS